MNGRLGLELVLLMGLLHWGGYSAAKFARAHPAPMQMTEYADFGEALVHRIRSRAPYVSYRMPMATDSAARLQFHGVLSPAAAASAGQILLIVLVFALGVLLHPLGGLFSAAAAASLVWAARDFNVYPDSIYALLVLLAAGVLVWRERAPSRGRTILLAAALGLTLLWRSPLALFPPLLALVERKGPRRRENRLILCLGPYLLLLPWLAFNWTVHRKVVLFEHRAASLNIATGALGLVENTEGDLRALTGDTPVLRWAAGEIARHPLRFLSAIPKRVAYALSEHPATALLALIALFVFRRRRGHQALGLLALYYLGIHCLFSVERRYFWPLWPLLAALAASLLAGRRPKDEAKEDAPEPKLAADALFAALLLASLAATAATADVAAFTAKLWSGPGYGEDDLSAALAAHPGDPWLLRERGRLRLNEGRAEGAAEDFAKAGERLQEARARLQLGETAPILAWTDPPGADFVARYDAAILKACALIRLGRTAEARPWLKTALDLYLGGNAVVRGEQGALGREVQGRLRTSDTGFVSHCLELQGAVPAAQRTALDKELALLLPAAGAVWIAEAELSAAKGRKDEAMSALARLETSLLKPDDVLRAAAVYQSLSEPRRALTLLLQHPGSDAISFALAEAEEALGRRDGALAALAMVEPRRLSVEGRRRLIEVRRRLGQTREAARELESLCADRPGDAGLLVDLAALKEKSLGDRAGALAALARARAVEFDAGAMARAAGLYREMGENEKARALYAELTSRAPRDAVLWVESAEVALALKDEQAARAALARAAASGPGENDSLRMIGLSRELKDWDRALDLTEARLSRRRSPSLLAEKGEILAAAGRRDAALSALAEAEAAAGDADLSRVAHAYQGLKEYAKAIAALDRLASRRPKDAEVLADRGLCAHLAGRSDQAVADLKKAIALDPDFLPAYLTLGAVYASRGKAAEELALYDAALKRKRAPLSPLLEQARAEAAARARPAPKR